MSIVDDTIMIDIAALVVREVPDPVKVALPADAARRITAAADHRHALRSRLQRKRDLDPIDLRTSDRCEDVSFCG